MSPIPILLLAVAAPAAAQYSLYTAMATTKGYVVGAKLLPSGVFRRAPAGEWRQVGHPHPFVFAVDYDPRDPSKVYVAAGNGIIRPSLDEQAWTFLTSADVTEARDVAVDRNGIIYFGHAAGIRVSRDAGTTWKEIGGELPRKFTETIRVDRERPNLLLAGTEDGLYRSEDAGGSWRLAGASGWQLLHIAQSPHDACHWMAATQGGGLFASRDCGRTFENAGEIGVDRSLYDIAFDPRSAERIAICGWGPGVQLSQDGGKTWEARNAGLPRNDVWSVSFDPAKPGRLYASVHEEALYVSDDLGATWRKDSLDGSIVYRMKWIPEGGAR
ncbi:MAG: hypothetical protein KIT09_31335 [Bryobacteraceae bacterium]|nr:hypothetical protein [Bryobacteraceae bacterium]